MIDVQVGGNYSLSNNCRRLADFLRERLNLKRARASFSPRIQSAFSLVNAERVSYSLVSITAVCPFRGEIDRYVFRLLEVALTNRYRRRYHIR